MAGLRSLGTLIFLIFYVLFKPGYSSPVNISLASVPQSVVQSAINALNVNSPTQHTYRGGNLISAQKLREPGLVIYRLTLNLDPVCGEGSTNCPREACAIDLKDRSGAIEIDPSSIQCMYLYPQSTQEDVQQQTESIIQEKVQASDNVGDNGNTLELDHEVEPTADSQRQPEANLQDKPFIAMRAPSSNYCPGCPYELNPNLPGLTAFGVQALDVMDRLGHNDFKHKLIKILRVTRAVPPSTNVVQYKLIAEIGETNCLKTTLIDRSECSLQGNIPVRVCLITFEERPWQQSDRQVVGNNCTEPSDLENEINASLNAGLNGNSYPMGNGHHERVDSVQEVIGKTAHIDQLAQEGKIGTYDSLIDQILESPAANVTSKLNIAEVHFFERVSSRENPDPNVSIRRDVAHESNVERTVVTEAPFVKVELDRDDDTQTVQGFVDKQREFDEFLSDFDLPIRDLASGSTEETRQAVTENIIKPQRVGGQDTIENNSSSSEEDSSTESDESSEDSTKQQRTARALIKSRVVNDSVSSEETSADVFKDSKDDLAESQKKDTALTKLIADNASVSKENSAVELGESEEDAKESREENTSSTKLASENHSISSKENSANESGESKEDSVVLWRRKRAMTKIPWSERSLVEGLAQKAVDTLDDIDQDDEKRVVRRILESKREKSDGFLYHLVLEVALTDCSEVNDHQSNKDCLHSDVGPLKICKVQIHTGERDPLLSARVIKSECLKDMLRGKNARNRRSSGIPGALHSISTHDANVRNYATLGFQKYLETFEGTNEPVLINITSATYQVQSGRLYKIKVSLGTTNCPRGTKSNCQLLANSETKECKVKAWVRPWLEAQSLQIQTICNENSSVKRTSNKKNLRNKREVPLVGAANPISIADATIENYANLGFQKYSETFEGTNEPFLIKILSATKQIVSGTLYKINISLGTSNCSKGIKENCQLLADSAQKNCEVSVWSRPWLANDSLVVTLNCDTNGRSKRSLRGKNYSQKMLEQASFLKRERLFNDFIGKYNKTYSSSLERKNRFKIFQQNMMMVQELQRNEQGTAIYGASIFADLTTEEFKKMYLGLKPELRLDNEIPIPMAEIPNIEIPAEYDWRNYNIVTPVKNQGQCGSCWAFSVTGNVEGQYALRHRNLLSFSEQELVDCDTLDEGCNGGLPDNAYRAIEKLGGLELESDYPYDGENVTCRFNNSEIKVKVVSAVNITSNETQMAQWLVQNGPISIGINANAMQFYMGGVSHPFKFLCSPDNLDHGVLIVGYGVHTYPIFHKTLPYWTIKNSWGPMWGEKGYYRVYRGDGTCGVNQMASSAIVA